VRGCGRCLSQFQELAAKNGGLDDFRVFDDPDRPESLWFMEDGQAIAALLPSDSRISVTWLVALGNGSLPDFAHVGATRHDLGAVLIPRDPLSGELSESGKPDLLLGNYQETCLHLPDDRALWPSPVHQAS
jgi:hypothetical protein